MQAIKTIGNNSLSAWLYQASQPDDVWVIVHPNMRNSFSYLFNLPISWVLTMTEMQMMSEIWKKVLSHLWQLYKQSEVWKRPAKIAGNPWVADKQFICSWRTNCFLINLYPVYPFQKLGQELRTNHREMMKKVDGKRIKYPQRTIISKIDNIDLEEGKILTLLKIKTRDECSKWFLLNFWENS